VVGSLSCSQELTTFPCPEPDQSSLHDDDDDNGDVDDDDDHHHHHFDAVRLHL
jgi:hypothetical protein